MPSKRGSAGHKRSRGARVTFGNELKHQRDKVEMTQAQLGEALGYSDSQVGNVETGVRKPSRDLAVRCDEILGTDGVLARQWDTLDWETYLPWFRRWVDVEREAEALYTWESQLIPGLLQTEDYARETQRHEPGVSADQVEEAVAARMDRKLIFESDDPPLLWVLLDEGVLRRMVGSAKIMYEQLRALVQAASGPNISIRIIPANTGVPIGLTGAFSIATVSGQPDTVYLESAVEGTVSDRLSDARTITNRYHAIQALALTAPASIELITRVMEEEWKPQS